MHPMGSCGCVESVPIKKSAFLPETFGCNHKETFACHRFHISFYSLASFLIVQRHSNLIIYQNQFLRTLFLWPQTAGWLLGRSHKPGEQRLDTEESTKSKLYVRNYWAKKGNRNLNYKETLIQSPFNLYASEPCLTSWYFSSAMLVSAASGVSMKISLFLWMFSRMPCKQTHSIHIPFNKHEQWFSWNCFYFAFRNILMILNHLFF